MLNRYISPTPGPLPGEQYKPSNSNAGYGYIGHWCANCARDVPSNSGKDWDLCEPHEVCSILTASFAGEAVEWRELADGSVKCIAFVPMGERIPEPRCERTQDMFG